ncbi:MAG: T9SS type A sorting domain-containing protein [Ignavibacteriaceae bacterium]|nr:T9SS type A sorting domain-containing protein [Ignavibacteriaceae bacterium]
MKKFKTFIFVLILFFISNGILSAQSNPVNFETGGFGATWTWNVFENGDNPPVQIIPNPAPAGVNTSATVAKFTVRVAGAPWAGTITQNQGVFTLDSTNCTIKIMVWKSVISDVGIKFEANLASTGEIKVANTLVNQWEELTFDFSGRIGAPSSTNIDALIVFPDFNARTTEHIVYFDNITFSPILAGPTTPTVAAPTPTYPSGNVISLFSNAYTNVLVDTWSASWDQADVEDVLIAGNDTKKYTNLVFAGIEFTTQPVNATTMTHFRMDIWTPDPTALPAVFRIKLVDFGANGVFGGGDDTEHELIFNASTNPPLVTGNWLTFNIPFTAFTGLVNRGHLAQMIISGDPNTVFVDNVLFYQGTVAPTTPTVAAPAPPYPAAQVISLFSNSYPNVLVDTWSASWDQADVEDVLIAGNDTKKYTNLVFAGIEFTTQPINASPMTHFHMDIWTPDPTALPAVFRIKLVDFGANGVFGGGDDTEHELTFNASSTPPLVTGNWIGFDIPFSAFTGLVNRGHLAQLIISGDPNTVFVDNVYFHTGIVPVELTSFTASVVDESVVLNWTTASETNNQGFSIEKSSDNSEFSQVHFVSGNGTTLETSLYTYTDNQVLPGKSYYRLKQIDFDGTFAYSPVVEVNIELPVIYSLEQNYPNPFNPSTKISFSLPATSEVSLKVFNMLGQEMATLVSGMMNAGKYDIAFDASDFASGNYIYVLSAGSFKSVKKMILIK